MSVEDYTLEVEPRTERGSSAVARLRRKGLIPSVVYSKHTGDCPVSMSYRDFVQMASSAQISQVFTLKSSDSNIDGSSVIVKAIQRDYLKDKVLHVDFQALQANEAVTVSVRLDITGEPEGVKNEGGILTISTDYISVSCIPRKIPKQITVDVTELGVGSSVSASDIDLPEGVELAGNPEETIASVVTSRLVLEAETEEEGEAVEGAEGEEGEAAAAGEEGEKADKAEKAPEGEDKSS